MLTGLGFVSFGLLGLWQQSMDTLALTLAAVLISLAIGIPLGVWMGLSRAVERVLTPVLDFMQTMPTFVYLAPLTLFFLIGPASAVIATLIYAAPPVIRITAHGIREVSGAVLEASDSREALRSHFEVDRHWIVVAALKALADDGRIDRASVTLAMKKVGIDPDKPDPRVV